MMTRAESMKLHEKTVTDADRTKLHRDYYAQFVSDKVRTMVLRSFGKETLVESFARDKHFNSHTTPLRQWDALVRALPSEVVTQLKAAGDWLSLGTGVCILKEAARQIAEQE